MLNEQTVMACYLQLWFLVTVVVVNGAVLYPRDTLSRETKSLDGVWQFRTSKISDQEEGFRGCWYKQPLQKSGWSIPMPVPSSYNDITQSRAIRDFIGWAWYQREFVAPRSWKDGCRIMLRFGSVHYYAQVYLNGENVVNHTGGHLPFEVDVTRFLKFTSVNNLVVAVNNTLTMHTIPQGSVTFKQDRNKFPENFYTSSVNFDFFNYAGIHRSVVLYTTPTTYVKDFSIVTDIKDDNTGEVSYSVSYFSTCRSASCLISIIDADSNVVAKGDDCHSVLNIKDAKLWWPSTMSPTPGYLYTFQIELSSSEGDMDVYSQRFGIRTIKVDKNSFLINNKPFYFMGFGMHEDYNVRGRGLDLPMILKDFNLINWIGANCFRTSHYPYSEEIMDQADEQGIVVIDESPAVGLDKFTPGMLEEHKRVMAELVSRDKNRPSVVIWSVANEPHSFKNISKLYFRDIVKYTRALDPTRPISAALHAQVRNDQAGQYMDIIMMNRYFAWYSDTGHLEVIRKQTINDFTNMYDTYKKPIMISEYGADTVPGYHISPSFVFTEDYQSEYYIEHHLAFDQLRSKGFFIGEMTWCFADFMTVQQVTRVVGNKKGIFTRDRQPKAAAKLLRCRYLGLANATLTDDSLYCPAPRSAFRGVWNTDSTC